MAYQRKDSPVVQPVPARDIAGAADEVHRLRDVYRKEPTELWVEVEKLDVYRARAALAVAMITICTLETANEDDEEDDQP